MIRRAALCGALGLGVLASPARAMPYHFTLYDGQGQMVTADSFPGRLLLVFFGYTHCPDICPATLEHLAKALQTADPQGKKLQGLFISIDPAEDSPALASAYAALFSRRIIGLSGSASDIAAAEREFHVYVRPLADGGFAHGALIYALDDQGQLRAVIPDGLSTAQLSQRLSALLANGH